MKTLLSRLESFWEWLTPTHPSITDLTTRRQAQLSMAFSLILCVGVLGPTIFGRQDSLVRNGILEGLSAICFISYLAGRTRLHRWGALLLVFGMAGTGFLLVMTGQANNISSAFSTTIPFVLVIGSVLLSVRGQFFLTLFCGVGPMLLPFISAYVKGSDGIYRDGGVFLCLGLSLIGITIFRNRLEENRMEEIKSANQSLRALQLTLEEKIIERTTQAEHARAEAENSRAALQNKLDEVNAISQINETLRGQQNLENLSQNILRQLCQSLGAQTGTIFARDGETLRLVGSYAYQRRKGVSNVYRLGEGLIGQAALEKQPIIISEIPPGYISIGGGMLEMAPRNILALPLVRDEKVLGVIEIATLEDFSDAQIGLLEKFTESISIAFDTAQARTQIDTLLEQTQTQARELQIRESELKNINQTLEAQAESLRASQDTLRRQQAELLSANTELAERTNTLQKQRIVLDQQNRELTTAQAELERKAEELTLANKYKSEFLANMSHELRTPLNSLLILSRMFAENEGGNLTTEQIESARIIYNSGSDLLNLINEILDLSKVEAGRMSFHFEPMRLRDVARNMQAMFQHVADEKSLEFEISLSADLPETVVSDQQRVEQVLRNLLSNAFKFTEKGKVSLGIETVNNMVAIHVRDSGIGMAPEQQARVFEAFQQADGSTSRKYGGTGLGLTISREMASRMGGKIELQSQPGQGSTFTLYLPLQLQSGSQPAPSSSEAPSAASVIQPTPEEPVHIPHLRPRTIPEYEDDRAKIQKGDKVLLVIEDDENFAKVLYDYAHKKDFKCLLAPDGETGLKLTTLHKPDAILLDLNLPGISGLEVLDTLKSDASLRHIPVHVLSASEENMDVYKHGALGFLGKPVSQPGLENVFGKLSDFLEREIKSLLIVEDDNNLRHSVRQLLGGGDVKISEAVSGESALTLLREHHFDCMILDLTLPDMSGFELLNRMNHDNNIRRCPVVVYTGKALSEEENDELLKYANSVIIKGVKSPERLMDETALFLHRVVADMPAEKQDTIRRLHDRDAVFSGKHVLVVDDDMRNAYALSRLLSGREIKVTMARSGIKALEILEGATQVDLVLMDIMMPEMDGYETMRRIRAQSHLKSLPILALTAKAMKGDLEKCIAAGANDYLSKPIDAERLFSMLRVWLYR